MDFTNEKEGALKQVDTPSSTTDTHLSTSEPAQVPPPQSSQPKSKQLLAKLLIVGVLLLGIGYYVYTNDTFTDDYVAEVNGKKISKTEYDESLALIQQTAVQQGFDLTALEAQEEIKAQALDVLINNALLITAAQAIGIEVSDAEVLEKYDELAIQLGGVENLNIEMEKVGLSEEQLKNNIEDRILADKYIESVTAIEETAVSDEEVAAFFKTLTESGNAADLPPLDEIRAQIVSELSNRKQQTIINDLLIDLRSEADIEVRI